ncbi:MAG TPA: nuclear transport factor 2 family protein [Candidatus Binataceae bacterium]
MDVAAQKERALVFLDQMNHPDANVLAPLITDDFEFEFMMRSPSVNVQKHDEFLKWFPKIMKSWFPNGLNMKFHTVVAEGPYVAVQAEADTVAGNGKHYSNRYHFFIRFEGDRIAQAREYNDTNHVRETFFPA